MSAKANHVVCTLYRQSIHDCRRIAAIKTEKDKLYKAYSGYRTLLREEEDTCGRVTRVLGILGKYSPVGIHEGITSLISVKPINFSEVRRDLKIWEILEVYLSAKDDKSTVADFQGFLSFLEIDATPQAIESTIKVHPELFHVFTEEGRRFLTLKHP